MQPHAECQKLLSQISVESTQSLFEAYGLSLTRYAVEKVPGHEILMCGVIGFTGPTLRGTVILAANEMPLIASNPVHGSPLRDWIAELTNQLAGRVKNRLRAYGIEIYITTPVVLRGEHLAPVPRAEIQPECFEAPGGGVLWVWTEGEAPEGFVLAEADTADDSSVNEGDALMF